MNLNATRALVQAPPGRRVTDRNDLPRGASRPRRRGTAGLTTALEEPAGRRTLAASAAIGACVGLAIGSAYVAGALARASVEDAQSRLVAGFGAAAAPAPAEAAPASASAAPDQAAGAATPAAAVVGLRGSAAPARDLECLSQAVYYEARGEAERGRQAVAQVVINRTRQARFPRSICGVVFQHAVRGCAFAFACDGQTRRALEPAAWRDARRIAQRTLAGFVLPEVRSATDFRSGGHAPAGLERVAQIGAHVFFRGTVRPRHAAAAPVAAAPAEAPRLMKADAPAKPEAQPPSTPAA